MKNILVIDDSTLMRRVLSDIINESKEYQVKYVAQNGIEGLKILELHKDIYINFLDIHMPRMNGIEFLEIINKKHIKVDIFVFSSIANEDGEETMKALELGALEFVKKPTNILSNREKFKDQIFRIMNMLEVKNDSDVGNKFVTRVTNTYSNEHKGKGKLVAIACSTGGPKALQDVIPKLPANLNAPVLIVQHMPVGFTKSLADRLNELSDIEVKESSDNEKIKNGTVYIAQGGKHLLVNAQWDAAYIEHSNEVPVSGLKPYANYMYNSLLNSNYEEIICVVLTGMGNDGTDGIKKLNSHKNIYVMAQDAESSVVYGMPRAVTESGLVDEILTLSDISKAIIKRVGVN